MCGNPYLVAGLNVELKDQGNEKRNDVLVRQVVRRIVAAGCTELALLSSFNHAMLVQCRGLAPFISRAVLYGGSRPPDLLDLLAAVDACACHPEHSGLDAEQVHHLQQNGYAVHAWTVNEPERWQHLRQCMKSVNTTWKELYGLFPFRELFLISM